MTFLRTGRRQPGDSPPKVWRAGAYLRLSREDGDKPESDSIHNQHRIIAGHVERLEGQGERFGPLSLYTDDGYAGGTLQRPAFQRMLADIEAGGIDCVIFKDLSRLGRNYPELGRLMEDYFPQKGVRVISVLNQIDSLRSPETYCSAIVSFFNIVNDDYIRQLSVKIKSTLGMKRSAGEFIGNYAPYGYVKSPEDRHRLAVDPEAAEVVRMIFRWYAGGSPASAITRQLNALRILPPSWYKAQQGCKGFGSPGGGSGAWSLTTVNTILRDEVYIGNLVQGKYKSVSYRTKKMVPAPQEEWIVVEGTHEAIISDEQFAIVHDRLARHIRVPPGGTEPHLFSGLVFCGSCGRRLTRCISNGRGRFRCPTRTYAPGRCQCPSIAEGKLAELTLRAIQIQAGRLADLPAAVEAAKKQRAGSAAKSGDSAALRRAVQERERLESASFRLYDDLQRGVVDRGEYDAFRARYKSSLAAQDACIRQLQARLAAGGRARDPGGGFADLLAQSGTVPALDHAVLSCLVDRIVVEDAAHIHICFKCSDGAPRTAAQTAPDGPPVC